MEGLQAMLQQHMQQQMEMQKQMMLAMAKLTNASPPEAPKTPVFVTPVLPPPHQNAYVVAKSRHNDVRHDANKTIRHVRIK